MGAHDGLDFLNSDFPMYAAGGVGLLVAYRAFVGRSRGEPIQPAWMSTGVFPAAFFTFVGTMACHEMLLDMMGFPGGLTAWAPAVLTVFIASWVAYRGQRAASGGDLGMATIIPLLAFASLAVSWLVSEEPEVPQKLTKAQMKKAAKEAAKRAAKNIVEAPTAKMLALEKGKDIVVHHMPVVLGVVVLVILVLALVNGPGVWPRNLQKGSFPVCFMVATGVLAWNSFVREARFFENGHLDDFIPAFAAMVAASFVAHKGAAMQSPSVV